MGFCYVENEKNFRKIEEKWSLTKIKWGRRELFVFDTIKINENHSFRF